MRTFVYGRPALRSGFAQLRDRGHPVLCHVTGQSLITLGRPSPTLQRYADARSLTSRVQRRTFDGTVHADLLQQVRRLADDVDVVVWDLSDEQLGVYCLPDGGYVTRTAELVRTGLDSDIAREATFLRFGTEEHLRAWSRALAHWAQALRSLNLEGRTVLAPPTPDGAGRLPPSSTVPGDDGVAEVPLGQYIEQAVRALPGARTASPPGRVVPAGFAHDEARTGSALEATRVEHLAHSLDVLARDHSFPPPRPILGQGGAGRTIRVHTEKTWAKDFALYVFRGGEAVLKYPYQATPHFDVELPGAGTYQFRIFHRDGDVRRAISSAPVNIAH